MDCIKCISGAPLSFGVPKVVSNRSFKGFYVLFNTFLTCDRNDQVSFVEMMFLLAMGSFFQLNPICDITKRTLIFDNCKQKSGLFDILEITKRFGSLTKELITNSTRYLFQYFIYTFSCPSNFLRPENSKITLRTFCWKNRSGTPISGEHQKKANITVSP